MRNIICDAVVLRTRRQGDYDKELTLFSAGLGLLRARVYGAYRGRSRLSGSTEQFLRLKVYLYHNPVKDVWKVTDAEVVNPHRGILSSLDKIMAASAGAEIILKTDAAGGEGEKLYKLLLNFLDSLDRSEGDGLEYLLLQFLMRYIELSGYKPDLTICQECGRTIDPAEGVVFSPDGPVICCTRCGGPDSRRLPEGARKYIIHTGELPWEKAVKIRMDRQAARQCRSVLVEYVQALVERPIHSLNGGGPGV